MSQKLNFYMKKILLVCKRPKKHICVSKGNKPDFFVNFSQFHCSWIRIGSSFAMRIQDSEINADPDPQPENNLKDNCLFRTSSLFLHPLSLSAPGNTKLGWLLVNVITTPRNKARTTRNKA
jgi:hypothetical protein